MSNSYASVTLRHIEVFRAIMLSGGITSAAALLNVTQPGVSRLAKHLELRLGVRLFERVRGRLLPTAEARLLFERVQRVYDGVASIQLFAKSLRDGVHSSLRIVCSPSIALDIVPRAMRAQLNRLPNLQYQLEVSPLNELINSLINNDSDVGVCVAEVAHPALARQKISDVQMTCVVPIEHELCSARSVSIRDLGRFPFVSFDAQTYQGTLLASAFHRSGVPLSPIAKVRFARTACSLVAAGVGVSIVDQLTAANADGSAIKIIPLRPTIKIPIYALWSDSRAKGAFSEGFVSEVKTVLVAAQRSFKGARM
jgi:DNA-binding transcriptional LysR family regulator